MRREGLLLGGIGLITLIIVIAAAFFLSGPQSTPESQSEAKVTDTALLFGPEKDRTAVGSPSAKVSVVEFGDFQCPACGAAHPVVKQVLNEYKDKVYFVFRNFPLPQHGNAALSAEAALAAGAQGKFWEMHDALYENQTAWGEKSGSQAKTIIQGYAQNLNLDMTAFNQTIDSNTYKDKIQKDQTDGYQLGINSTPTFFINGEKFTGIISYDQFKQLLDDRLK